MSSKNVPITSNRRRIYHFLRRSQRFHAPCSAQAEIDVTDLFAAIAQAKARGEQVGVTAAVAKACGMIVRAHPRFHQHLFHGLRGRRAVEFDGVHATLMVQRTDAAGEDVLFGAILRDCDRQPVTALHATIDRYKHAPVEELPEYQALAKLGKLPAPARLLMSYALRASPRFFEQTIGGSFGISAYAGGARVPIATGHALSPLACSFFVGAAVEKPWVVNGAVVPRRILSVTVTIDHFLIDGVEVVAALSELGDLLASPAALGLAAAVRSAA